MKTARVATLIFCCSVSMVAQFARPQNASVLKPSPGRPAAEAAAPPDRPSLGPTLADLQRITAATGSDLSDLQIDKWKSGWRTAWLKGSGHKQEAQEMAMALRRNLADAVPVLITEVQNSHGSVSSAFKLYNDLSVVVESLDSLVAVTRDYGRKGESGSLAKDDAALGRLRQDISSYIQLAAASLEPKTKAPTQVVPSASGSQLKKVSDDDAPETKPARKKTVSMAH
jgi:hypothetical protein